MLLSRPALRRYALFVAVVALWMIASGFFWLGQEVAAHPVETANAVKTVLMIFGGLLVAGGFALAVYHDDLVGRRDPPLTL